MTVERFLEAIETERLTALDRALSLLWWVGLDNTANGMSARAICAILERNGHPKQNVFRLNASLAKDRRTAKADAGAWRLHPRGRKELDERLKVLLTSGQSLATDSVLPQELFHSTRGYLERVVDQLNASYDLGLFDCCTVMCRRILETLLLEVYESVNRADEVKDCNGNFLMFAGLLAHFEKDKYFHPSRNALKGLRDFKALGDLSAHNRRFNARRDDIDRVRDGLRIAAEELLNLAGLAARNARLTASKLDSTFRSLPTADTSS
jgi:hypothetical protein